MNIPPYVIDLKIRPEGHTPFHIWLPLFLLWPLFLVLGVISLVLTILVDIALWAFGQRYHYYTLLLLGVFEMFTELRGTTIYVRDATNLVDVTIR